VDKSIALAYLQPAFATADAALAVTILGEDRPARLAPAPLYDPTGARMRG
jgi:dimethylglycine dehydrogenase